MTISATGVAQEKDYGSVVPAGARAGDLTLAPCNVHLEGDNRQYAGDCGTLVVPENRNDPGSRLIALPVTRVNATGKQPLEPLFWFQGGPGSPNKMGYPTDGLLERHDLVMVGYRALDGQVHIQCPEISDALRNVDKDYLGRDSLNRYAEGAKACVNRLAVEGIDLDGYSINQTIEDNEAARKALGYERINLFGNSYGTRVQMLYQWRHPDSIHRNVMVAVNPPGHFIFDPQSLERILQKYSRFCQQDAYCSSRTPDLYATMQQVERNMPRSWMGIDIDPDLVKFITNIGWHESLGTSAMPLHAPAAIDMWLDAAEGDASGMALVSLLAPLILPEAFDWGHFFSMGGSVPDFNDPDRDYLAELATDTGDTVIGSPLSLFHAGIMPGWTVSTDQSVGEVQASDIETLMIGGTLDGSTPFEYARDELLPHLSNGHQVVIKGQGHTETFWYSQDEARARLLNTYFESGKVDDSLFVDQPPLFDVDTSWGGIAKALLAVVIVVLSAIALVTGLVIRKLLRNSSYRKTVEA
ncbi:alpha/beta hydrolase [Pseudomaricurvus alkylphenolicus]|uniref:alpha/beta hydrolase n=1 Tax=Pseudomaricurvus alkylphenolicus TaxID=1306991 RepID=UPI0014232666|nr:alpha/beta hydrolase [Pseudomaricurvus alkylphenolicus]NIB38470.1 alpha/beta hydrolase [Pseudomaricurvus alkylphenolicus]